MFSWDDPADRVAIAHMNAELQHAQLELLSAHCATHQLRLRYSAEDLARFGRRDILRKSFEAATAISQYYGAIEKKVPPSEAISGPPSKVTPEQIKIAEARVVEYLREQQNFYGHAAVPLTNRQRALMWPYFSPAFYPEYRALGFANLPEVTHMPSLTFLDVVVFNEHVTERSLFHGLVHVVQFEVLGLERYAELFVRSFVTTKLHFTVPLEAHAFSLESKFVAAPASRFSVEEQVRLWVKQERY
jgi:hypothetical protein